MCNFVAFRFVLIETFNIYDFTGTFSQFLWFMFLNSDLKKNKTTS